MNETAKPLWQSATFWGVIVTAVSGLLGRYGVTLTPDDQHSLAAALVAVAAPLGILVGLVMGVWGRVRARQPIAPMTPPPGSTMPSLIAVLCVCALLGGCAATGATGPGAQALRIGQAVYDVECKTVAPAQIGAAAVTIAAIVAPDSAAAASIRRAVAAHDAMIARLCPTAALVEIAVAGP